MHLSNVQQCIWASILRTSRSLNKSVCSCFFVEWMKNVFSKLHISEVRAVRWQDWSMLFHTNCPFTPEKKKTWISIESCLGLFILTSRPPDVVFVFLLQCAPRQSCPLFRRKERKIHDRHFCSARYLCPKSIQTKTTGWHGTVEAPLANFPVSLVLPKMGQLANTKNSSLNVVQCSCLQSQEDTSVFYASSIQILYTQL